MTGEASRSRYIYEVAPFDKCTFWDNQISTPYQMFRLSDLEELDWQDIFGRRELHTMFWWGN